MEDETDPRRECANLPSVDGKAAKALVASLDHPLVLAIRALETRAKRDEIGRFFVSGIRFVDRAAAAGWPIDELVLSPVLLRSRHGRTLARRLEAAGVDVSRVTPEVFRALSTARRASGLGAVIRMKRGPLGRERRRDGIGWVAVDGIRSPGNLGTLLRTLRAVDGTGLITVGDQVDPFDPAVVRASMGALFGLRIAHTPDFDALATWARRRRCRLVAADGRGRSFARAELRGPVVLYLGHEGRGLSAAAARTIDHRVALPMPGGVDSLNVAVAGSVLLYEVWRQSALRRR